MKTNEQLMKACQIGCNNLNDANNLLAECYGRIGKLADENERLKADAERIEWQPIETAPKDEPILVGPTKRMGICVAMYCGYDGWVTETCVEWVSIYTPTHWMPLPEPPK